MTAELHAIHRSRQLAIQAGVLFPPRLTAKAVREYADVPLVLDRHPRTLSHVRSSQAVIVPMDAPEPSHPSDGMVLAGSILACVVLAAILIIERLA